MDIIVIIILILVALGGIGAFFYVLTYNKIQKHLIRIKEAESEIDESLRKKYDILTTMEKTINELTDVKQKNFEDIEANSKISNFEFDRKLTKVQNTFEKIESDYEDSLDTDNFRKLVTELKIVEEKNVAAKTYYNKYTTKLNLVISKFPSNLVARIHKISEHLYFDNKNMNDDDITDFKI